MLDARTARARPPAAVKPMKEHPLVLYRRRARLRRKRVERLNEAEHRIGRLTSMIAQMETERLRLIVESTTLRNAIEDGDQL